MSTEDEIRAASEQFYAALNRMANGDAAGMAGIWSHDKDVTAMHPIGDRRVGWDAIRESFEEVARLAQDGKLGLRGQLIRVVGDLAYEVGVEQGHLMLSGRRVAIDHRVTNIYQRQGGAWKIVHHHTDTSPAMLDVVGRLQPPRS